MWRIVRASLPATLMVAVGLGFSSAKARMQGEFEITVLDGVYTEGQAFRGEEAFVANCEGCHVYGEPDDAAPPLLDIDFLDRWREAKLGPLFDHMRTRMPAHAPGSLGESTYIDILSYILWEQGSALWPRGTDPGRDPLYPTRRSRRTRAFSKPGTAPCGGLRRALG